MSQFIIQSTVVTLKQTPVAFKRNVPRYNLPSP